MQIRACNSSPIYQVYLDLSKVYDSIDREKTLKIMEKYKIGPNIRNYVRKVWDRQVFSYASRDFTATASRLSKDARNETQTHQ